MCRTERVLSEERLEPDLTSAQVGAGRVQIAIPTSESTMI